MRKVLVLLLSFLLISISASFAQGLMDYVKEVKGDTLVVNNYLDMGFQPNSLNNVVTLDAAAPAGRVYQLQTNGWYPQTTGVTTPSDRPVIIAGADNTPLVNRTSAENKPPIISGYVDDEGTASGGGITWGNDLTVKNSSIIVGAPDGTGGWAFFGAAASNRRVVFQNNMMEHNWWIFVNSNGREGNSIHFKDNYFVNMSGRACWRNGGVYDNVDFFTDTMYVENNTHIMAQGMMYKFRNYAIPWIFINHNTFINCTGTFFETKGFQSNVIVTNNIFVNSNIHPHHAPHLFYEDRGEIDAEGLPSGLINVAPLPETMEQVDRKWLVEANLAYWDPKVADLAAEANTMGINGWTTNWVNQSIKMNDRTKGFFDGNTTYPFLTEGKWYDKLPNFTNPQDLLTAQVDVIKEFSLSTVDTLSTNILADWRVTSTGEGTFHLSDWPISVNLAYDDADLMAGGTDGLPVGDLNWFPVTKGIFNSSMDTYHTALINALNGGHTVLAIRELGGIPTQFKLTQNYPNPFNPTTMIYFTIPEPGNVTLKVYDVTGKEVATLVNGYKTAQSYEVQFDGANLSSGVYFYTLHTDNFTQTRKMVLMK